MAQGPNKPATADKWIKCISNQGNIRGVAIQATDLVRDLAHLHKAKGMAARGLGEAIMGGLLLSSYCKGGERVNLNIQGSGFCKQALVDAYPDGAVRGYVIENSRVIEDATTELGPWGAGLLSVLRTKEGEKNRQPYIGTVPLLTGHLAKDLTFYWLQSEQVHSAVGLAVNMDGNDVTAAAGFLVQALPGADMAEIRAIEKHINELESLSSRIAKNADAMNLLTQIFQSSPFMLVEERALEFRCNCSWERVNRALTLVGVTELRSMLAEDNQATVHCDFCCKEYVVTAKDLERMIKDASGN